MPTPSYKDTIRDRKDGRLPTGTVDLRAFDHGIVYTLGATLETVTWASGEVSRNYYLNVPLTKGRVGRPGLPGVPIIFAFPEDVLEKFDYPLISVRRDDISPALSRWHPGTLQYRAPAATAMQVETILNPGNPVPTTVTGWNQVEELQQAAPFDISYTISILARNRGGMGQTNQANAILKSVLQTYQPYSTVNVIDSLGDTRSYQAFMESVSHLDEVPEVAARVIGFAVTVRVEAELDLLEPEVQNTVTSLASTTTEVL